MKSDFNLNKAIDKTVSGIASLFTEITYVDCFWPNPSNKGYSIFLKDYIVSLLDCIKKLEEKKTSDEELAKLFGTATNVFRVFVRIGRTKKFLPKNKRMYLAKKLLKSAFLLRSKRAFSAKKNIIFSSAEINSVLKEKSFIKPKNQKQKDLFKKLNFLLYNCCETLYWTRWTTGCDFHGPYCLKNGKTMVVKDFFDLKPTGLWKETKDFLVEKAKIFIIYKNVEWINIDQYGHITSSDKLTEKIDSVCFEIETEKGRILNDWKELEKNLPLIESEIFSMAEKINSLPMKKVVAKQAEIEWYLLKNLLLECGFSIKPPERVYKRIRECEIKDSPILKSKQQSKKQRCAYYLSLLDPRTD
jgi:hypothetical protein